MDTDDGADPAIERVRRELALLGREEASAQKVPAEVTARIGAALRGAPPPAHSVPRPRLSRRQLLGLVVGTSAALIGVAVGVSMLMREPAPRFPAGPTAQSITVSRPAAAFPLTEREILDLLTAPPEYGPLSDARRRGACLQALGHRAATPVLGARSAAGAGGSGVVLVLAGDSPDTLAALLVGPNCGAGHSGLAAETTVRRP